MKTPEQSEFEDSWRQAFEDASLAPPESTWKRIEAQLPPPKKPTRWVLFALLGVVLFIGTSGWFGWQYLNDESLHTTEVPLADGRPIPSTSPLRANTLPIVAPLKERTSIKTTISQNQGAEIRQGKQALKFDKASTLALYKPKEQDLRTKYEQVENIRQDIASKNNPPQTPIVQETASYLQTEEALLPTFVPSIDPVTRPSSQWNISALKNKPVTSTIFSKSFREVHYQLAQPVERALSKKKIEWWMGCNVMMTSFNPNTRIDATALDAVAATNSSLSTFYSLAATSKPYSESKPGVGYLIDWHIGAAVTKHVVVEVAFQYWRGNSWLESNSLFVNRLDSDRKSIYNGFLANDQVVPVFGRQNILMPASSSYKIKNDYYYVSIPIKVGYRFNPVPRFETNVSGGLAGDFFQRNIIQNNGTVSLNANEYGKSDSWYKQLTMSALASVGIGYNLNQQWQATLQGTYRTALRDGIRQPSAAHMLPNMWSIGIGLNRKF